MISVLQAIWSETIQPMFRRPPALQLAALCHRETPKGVEVLLVTSSNGRWILPKGWPIDGMSASEAAQQEAWEEGGVKTQGSPADAIKTIQSTKTYDSGLTIPCETKIYELPVTSVANDYPEAHRRERVWVSPAKAADMVDETALKSVLRNF
jgi:8-oxo-dGTP pyrophosphatase MutT (NUDIX family)